MQPHDLKPFTDALRGAFDALGARVPGDAGIEVWFRTLKPFPCGDVVGALDHWVVSNRRAPTPNDIVDACRELAIIRREEQSDRWKRAEHNGPYTMGATETGRRALREINAMLAKMQRPRFGKQVGWAHKIIDRFIDHDPVLAPIAFDFACDALNKTPEERAELRALRASNTKGARRACASARPARETMNAEHEA